MTTSPNKPAPRKGDELLENFANPYPERDYTIQIRTPEFTCLCPKTGQPDFATLHLDYIPDQVCVELKSLKLYLVKFRNCGTFHETVTNKIIDDLQTLLNPRFIRLRAEFNVRGGIYTTIVVENRQSGWNPAPDVTLPENRPNFDV
ncbi:MAG: preQ(1) synthase [Candidatus Rariloculaceae bacterium]